MPQRSRRRTSARPAGAFLVLLCIVFSFVLAGCPCAGTVVNANPQLRWWLFSNFGASRICPEMLKLGVPLKLDSSSPAIGRFFPMTCAYSVDDAAQTVAVNFTGTGYGYMMPAKRVGFSCSAAIELRPDFQIHDDDIYVFGRMNRMLSQPDFRMGYIENPAFNVASNIPPFGTIANFFGNQVVASEITRGFTVVHNEDKGNEFTLGILLPPAKPFKAFNLADDQRYTFANEMVDVHGNSRDYLGPFEVSGGQSFFLTMSVQGQAVDVMIVDKRVGDAWREAYQLGQQLGPAPGPVVGGAPLYPGPAQTKQFNLPPGLYYVVIDNTQYAGLINPAIMPLNPLSDPVARVSYVAQVGD
ncbi:hypothetical protein [Polyangium aurulentum]|uniref:hypothetical protein n=1 Tax=Polyangium aurulentum TaxID=2567896 RepID=UPI0010AE2EBF|nr:hypothetical protein [Polyangium aurulentum]UQA62159.1 hypothetical protein E8A73_017495 [Polyangium aurulentum]